MATISNQAAKHINKEIGGTAMTRVLDLGNVLELINDGFNDRPAMQQDAVAHACQLTFHLAA